MIDSLSKDRPELVEKLARIPVSPGCYIFRDGQGQVLYVGKAVNLRSRVRSYFQKGTGHTARITLMVRMVKDVETVLTDTEMEALILESTLIKKHQPPYNVRLRDDKSYPYACITINDPYPRVFFTRKPHFRPDGNLYFGPFTNVRALRDTLRSVRRIFGVQSCRYRFTGKEKMRPCLYYHLNQCLGPCTGELSREEYLKAVRQVIAVFEGKTQSILDHYASQMETLAEGLEFERAAAIRDRIRAIERINERQKVVSVDGEDQDIIGLARDCRRAVIHAFFIRTGRLIGQENFNLDISEDDQAEVLLGQFLKQYYQASVSLPKEIILPTLPEDAEAVHQWLTEKRGKKIRLHVPTRGEKKRLLDLVNRNASIALDQQKKTGFATKATGEQACLELAEVLGLEMPPVRIECYDISNMQGGYTVGSMVVFEEGVAAKREYRHFRIRTVEGQDDFASMKEMISRRLARSAAGDERFSNLPDLMLIDGGKGQLKAALEAVAEAGEEELNLASLAKKEEEIFLPGRPDSIRLPRHSPALRLVQHIRDEAHRFAITYHRKLRGKGSLRSVLEGIPGVGPARRACLLKHFETFSALKEATLDEIASVDGMTRPAALRVFQQLHQEEENGSE